MSESIRAHINIRLMGITCWGDYIGGDCERSNSGYLQANFGNSLVTEFEGFGSSYLQLAPHVKSSDLQGILDGIETSDRHGEIDEDFGHEMRTKLIAEWVKEDGVDEVRSEFSKITNWDTAELITEDSVIATFHEIDLYPEFEAATSIILPDGEQSFARIAEHLTEQYARTLTESFYANIEPLIAA